MANPALATVLQRVLFVLCIAMPAASQPAPPSSLLAGMRDRARPVLVFAGPEDKRLREQYTQLATHASQARDRQVVPVFVTTTPLPGSPAPPNGTVVATPSEQAALRSRFHIAPGTFTVLLVGKDGGEKFRSTAPVTFATLSRLIDGMPMRRQEMRAH